MSIAFAPIRLTMQTLIEYIGLSESEINLRCNEKSIKYDPTFPKKIYNGKKVFFLTEEINTWVIKDAKKNRSG